MTVGNGAKRDAADAGVVVVEMLLGVGVGVRASIIARVRVLHRGNIVGRERGLQLGRCAKDLRRGGRHERGGDLRGILLGVIAQVHVHAVVLEVKRVSESRGARGKGVGVRGRASLASRAGISRRHLGGRELREAVLGTMKRGHLIPAVVGLQSCEIDRNRRGGKLQTMLRRVTTRV